MVKMGDDYLIDWTAKFGAGDLVDRAWIAEVLFRSYMKETLYGPLDPYLSLNGQVDWNGKTIKISAADSLSLVARDFFRVVNSVDKVNLQKLIADQKLDDEAYENIKKYFADATDFIDFEQWKIKVWTEENGYIYGVSEVPFDGREFVNYYRGNYRTWAIVKIRKSDNKLLAYNLFTRFVDRPNLVPHLGKILSENEVKIYIGQYGPEPSYGVKEGEKLEFKLREIR